MEYRKTKLIELAEQIEGYEFCSPSDDQEQIDAVIYGYKYLAKRFVGSARKINNQSIRDSIKELNIEVEDIYAVFDLHSNLQIIIDDLRELLNQPIEWSVAEAEFIDPSIIESLSQIESKNYDLAKVVEFCREINSTFNSGYYLATALLIRSLINHIPPIFGQETFKQVVSQSTRSRQKLLKPLDDTARGVADLHAHDIIRCKESLPTKRLLEPFKSNIEFLLQEILVELHKQGLSNS